MMSFLSTYLNPLLDELGCLNMKMSTMQVEMLVCVERLQKVSFCVKELIKNENVGSELNKLPDGNKKEAIILTSIAEATSADLSVDLVPSSRARLRKKKQAKKGNITITKAVEQKDNAKDANSDNSIKSEQILYVSSKTEIEENVSCDISKDSDAKISDNKLGICHGKNIIDITEEIENDKDFDVKFCDLIPVELKTSIEYDESTEKSKKAMSLAVGEIFLLNFLREKFIVAIEQVLEVKVKVPSWKSQDRVEVCGELSNVFKACEVIKKIVTPIEVDSNKKVATENLVCVENESCLGPVKLVKKAFYVSRKESMFLLGNDWRIVNIIEEQFEVTFEKTRNTNLIEIFGEEDFVEKAYDVIKLILFPTVINSNVLATDTFLTEDSRSSRKYIKRGVVIPVIQALYICVRNKGIIASTIRNVFQVEVRFLRIEKDIDMKLLEIIGEKRSVVDAFMVIDKLINPTVKNIMVDSKPCFVLEDSKSPVRIVLKALVIPEEHSSFEIRTMCSNISRSTETLARLLEDDKTVVIFGEEERVQLAMEKINALFL